MTDEPRRSTFKKDSDLPRGIVRFGRAYGIRFTCGAGHVHEEEVGPIKGDAIRAHAARRQRSHGEPGWCPLVERRQAREHAEAQEEQVRRRVTFKTYAEQYLVWGAAPPALVPDDAGRGAVADPRAR